jgi:DNA-binding LytR/AlgR family response regulator
MKKMTCIAIEDEPLSANVLKEHILEVPFLELKGVFHDAISAMNFLQETQVDLLFLDIHLPKLKGLDFLRTFNFTGQVIITSAHHEYALEGYELSIVDYLLKPISFERFLKGVQKAQEFYTYKNMSKNYETHISTTTDDDVIFFKSGVLIHKVDVSDITYLEKEGNYFNVHTKSGKKILIRINFADLTEKLPPKKFFRVHKSFIVAIRHIDMIEGNYVMVNQKMIPISLSFKTEFMKII